MSDALHTGENMLKSESFLAPSIAVSMSSIRCTYSTLFDLAQSFDNLGMQVLSNEEITKAHNGTNQQLIAVALYVRTLTSFQALYILAERGMLADARTILRSATETVICLVNAGNNEEICNLLMEKDKFNRRRLGNVLLKNPQASNEISTLDKKLIKATLNIIGNNKVDPIVIANLAGKAGMEELYDEIYRSTSGDAAHVTLDSLSRHVEEDANGSMQGLKFGPNVDDLEKTLFDAIRILGLALDTVITVFQIQDVKDELVVLVKTWKELSNCPNP